MTEIPCVIRPATAADDPIIYDSWARAMADEFGIRDEEGRRHFVREQKAGFKALLTRSKVLVACLRANPATVLGWCATEGQDILHFVFVKKPFRQGRVATRLLRESGIAAVARYSHHTAWGFPRIERLFMSLTFDPETGAM